MIMWWCLLILVILILYWESSRENFTIAVRDQLLCQPYINNDQLDLYPNSLILVIEGYNYQEPPTVYRDQVKLIPLRSEWDYQSMAYYYTLQSAPDAHWMIETTDLVEPIVHDGMTGERYKVTLERKRDGYNRWILS